MTSHHVQVAQAAAAFAAKCGTLKPAPVSLFHGTLQHVHWAVRHAANESFAEYTRAAVDDGDLRTVVPAELLAEGSRNNWTQCSAHVDGRYSSAGAAAVQNSECRSGPASLHMSASRSIANRHES